jgi:hypothetical protein
MKPLRTLSAAALVLGCVSGDAHAQEQGEENVAMRANRGVRVGLGPTILLPIRDGGPWGGGLTLDGRYGIKAGPTVIAPGGRLNGYVSSSRFIGMAMPTLRVTVPVGPLAPFLVGGVGGGWVTNNAETGLALLGGGGLMIHFGNVLAIGAEASYQTITNTEISSLTIGPALAIFGG